MWSICSSAGSAPRAPSSAQLLESRAARAHERELGRDEEAVDRDQQQKQDEQQDAHRLCGPVLRAGTSSAIRHREYSYPPRRSGATALVKCDIDRAMRVATLSEMLEEVVQAGRGDGDGRPRPRAAGGARGTAGDGPRRGRRGRLAAGDRPAAARPARVGGFWIPEMISIAGGEDVAGRPGLNPPAVGWGELASLGADVVVVMPEVSIENARAQAMEHWERIAGLGATRVYAVDGTLIRRPRAAAGRRGRAARPRPPPRPGRPAGQHRLRRAAGAAQATASAPTTESAATATIAAISSGSRLRPSSLSRRRRSTSAQRTPPTGRRGGRRR